MITIIRTIVISSLIFCGTQQNDQKACNIFNEHLNIIRKRIEKVPDLKIADISSSILFLENITLIKSKSDGNIYGRFNPTQDDFKKWSNWFKANKSRIYWDASEEKVKLKGVSLN